MDNQTYFHCINRGTMKIPMISLSNCHKCLITAGSHTGGINSPMSRIRSPGLFHFHPSSCWCSMYCSRRSWNTTRTTLCAQEQTGVRAKTQRLQSGPLATHQTAKLSGKVRKRSPNIYTLEDAGAVWRRLAVNFISISARQSHRASSHLHEEGLLHLDNWNDVSHKYCRVPTPTSGTSVTFKVVIGEI